MHLFILSDWFILYVVVVVVQLPAYHAHVTALIHS